MNRDLEGPDLNPVIVSLLYINTVESSLFMRDQFNVCGFRGQPLLMNLHHRKPIYTIICLLFIKISPITLPTNQIKFWLQRDIDPTNKNDSPV